MNTRPCPPWPPRQLPPAQASLSGIATSSKATTMSANHPRLFMAGSGDMLDVAYD